MWKALLILLLALPAGLALENIRKEVHLMRVRKGKAEPEYEGQEEQKFDNWYMGNEELMQQEKEKSEQKKLAKMQKQEKKAQKRAEKMNEKQKEKEIEL